MNVLRCTVVDSRGTISFVADGDVLPALVKVCATNPETVDEFLARVEPLYHGLRDAVLNGLAIFDERNANGNYAAIHAAFELCPPHEQPPFRVVDETTREMSLRPVKAGVVVFNLPARRIVQIQNSYREIRRRGRGRVFNGERFTDDVFGYRLPKEWALVP